MDIQLGNSSNMKRTGTAKIDRGHGEGTRQIFLELLTVNTLKAYPILYILVAIPEYVSHTNIIPCVLCTVAVEL